MLCPGCVGRIRVGLGRLPGLLAGLDVQMVPTPGHVSDRVSVGGSSAPMPGRLDALSMIGPGVVEANESAARQTVMVRGTRRAVVTVMVGPGRYERVVRDVPAWLPQLVGSDLDLDRADQVGQIPPAVWLDGWVRRWRSLLGHHVPDRTVRARPVDPAAGRRGISAAGWGRLACVYPPAGAMAVWLTVLGRAWRGWQRSAVFGLGPGVRAGESDPLGDVWRARYGVSGLPRSVAADLKYVDTWLEAAAAADSDIAAFWAGLRQLVGELDRLVGNIPDRQRLGRCPTFISRPDPVTNEPGPSRPCGAELRQDPHASEITCGKCRSTWGPAPAQVIGLSVAIRRVWPVDRHRRYDQYDIAGMVTPPCSVCGQPMRVWWADVTGTVDDRVWWRPTGVECAFGCRPLTAAAVPAPDHAAVDGGKSDERVGVSGGAEQ